MDEMNKKTEQEWIDREEIVNDLKSNIFVEAGAGAGKTTILVSRILNQLRTGVAKAEELVAITFTNKASQELKARIGDEVRKALHVAAPGTAEHANLKEALYNLDRMQISTIHSFCYRLLMEQTFLASMRMDMEMIEEEDAESEQSSFFHAWYKTLDYESVKHVRANFAGRKVFEVLKTAFSGICELPEDTEVFYDKELLTKSLQWFQNEAAAQKTRFAEIILDELDEETGRHFESLELAADADAFLSDFKKLVLGKHSDIDFLKKTSDIRIFKSGKSLGLKRAACDEMTEYCLEHFKQGFDLDAYDRDFRAYQNALILDFVMPARTEYRKLHQNRYITNDTLLEKARDLIVNHPEARAFFRKKYKCIYVDEFQDTDHIQTDLIFSLCSDENDGLKAGSLFVVGDPKQSIYRFRGADLPLYFSVKKRMSEMAGCKTFHLNYNFRSGKEVIDFVNGNNAQVLQDYQPMESRSCEPEENRPEKQLSGIYINWDPQMPIKDQGPRNDVEDVVGTIKGLVDKKIPVWDKEKGNYRSLCYKDFLVLCYSTNGMEAYLAAMLREGIPVQISGKVIMHTVRELRRFTNLYRYLAYPQYAKAREGALQTVLAENVNDDNYQLGMDRLNTIRDAVKGMDGISTALYLLRHSEYVLDWDNLIDKYYLLRIQAQLQQMTETVSSKQVNNAQALSDGFMEYVSGEIDRELSLSAESDAVRFMNLHKAKGLEGRVVIICKRSENFDPKEGDFQVRQENGNYLLYHTVIEKTGEYSSEKYPAYVQDDQIRKQAEAEELAEYRRLEYVEATRGMEALIFTMPEFSKKEKKDKAYSFKGYDFSNAKRIEYEFPEIYSVNIDEQNTDICGAAADSNYAEYDFDRWSSEFTDESLRKGYLSITPSGLEMKVKALGSDAEDADDETEFNDQLTEENAKRPTGNIFGTVMHRALELMVGRIRAADSVNDSYVNACILQAIMESSDEIEDAYGASREVKVREYREYLQDVLKNFIKNESLVACIRAAQEVYTEFPFSFFTTPTEMPEMFDSLRNKLSVKKAEKLLPADPSQMVWINGKADLILVNTDGSIRILDYKSDWNAEMSAEAFADLIKKRYGGQMEMYRHVCGKIFGVPLDQITGEFYLTD